MNKYSKYSVLTVRTPYAGVERIAEDNHKYLHVDFHIFLQVSN